ncbi:MAG: FadR family transcriptional regulator [Solirubrobacteraceae bacterium]|nr:FadR family transcriptional regulator [Solirubrobacteraceae bacterium]
MSSDQTAGSPPAFAQIARAERLSDKVASALTESILDGTMRVGDKLPPERELCEQFGVSRPVVREAVRSLIAKGLLADHPRRGHVVAALEPGAVTESLMLYVRGHELDYAHLLEIRAVLEVEAAGYAAERATDTQVEALRAAFAGLADGMEPREAAEVDVGFHRAIAEATGNAFFVILIDALREPLIDAQLPTLADPKIVKTARRAHKKILTAIADHDAAAARDAMRAHLDLAERQMREKLSAS